MRGAHLGWSLCMSFLKRGLGEELELGGRGQCRSGVVNIMHIFGR